MLDSILKRKGAKAAAAVAATGLVLPLLLTQSANADPRQHSNQVVAVGSDTTQEIINAFAGQAATSYYTPLASDLSNGGFQISSWDAVAPGDPQDTLTCIAPRAGFNAFQRPNGSSQGRAALSRSYDGAAYTVSNGDSACAGKSTAGIVDVARSSSGPSGTSGLLTYIPFGRDALTYAFTYVDGVAGDAGDATSNGFADLTFSELQSIFTGSSSSTTGGTTVRAATTPMLVIPCDIQSGSGTQKDWPGKVGGSVSATTIDNAANRCEALGVVGADLTGDLQESKPSQLEAKADLFEAANPGQAAMLIVGHSVSNYIAQSNGRSPSFLNSNVTLGSAIPGQAPFTGSAPNFVANGGFYNPASVPAGGVNPGRKVYNVLLTDTVTGPGNDGLKQLYIGASSKVCQAGTTIEAFGFLQLPQSNPNLNDRCGDTSATGDLVAN